MRTEFLLFATTALALITGCIHPFRTIYCSNETVTYASTPSGTFDRVEFAQACEAVITQGDAYSVAIELSENISNHLDIDKEGQLVRFSLNNSYTYHNLTFKVVITMPEIKSVEASGASSVSITGFSTDNGFSSRLSGSSSLIGDIECSTATFNFSGASTATVSVVCDAMTLDLSGASKITTKGSTGNIVCEASGASILNLREQPCADVRVNLSGASIMYASPSGTMSGDLSGASKLYYYGTPIVGTFDLSGASTVRKAQ